MSYSLTADPPCCHQKQQEKPLPPATSLQHPLQRKLNIFHTIKERCLKEFCSPSQHILEVNVEFKGNKLINGTLQLVDVERAWDPEWPQVPPPPGMLASEMLHECEINFCILWATCRGRLFATAVWFYPPSVVKYVSLSFYSSWVSWLA